jgi:hypothetical protein
MVRKATKVGNRAADQANLTHTRLEWGSLLVFQMLNQFVGYLRQSSAEIRSLRG